MPVGTIKGIRLGTGWEEIALLVAGVGGSGRRLRVCAQAEYQGNERKTIQSRKGLIWSSVQTSCNARSVGACDREMIQEELATRCEYFAAVLRSDVSRMGIVVRVTTSIPSLLSRC